MVPEAALSPVTTGLVQFPPSFAVSKMHVLAYVLRVVNLHAPVGVLFWMIDAVPLRERLTLMVVEAGAMIWVEFHCWPRVTETDETLKDPLYLKEAGVVVEVVPVEVVVVVVVVV